MGRPAKYEWLKELTPQALEDDLVSMTHTDLLYKVVRRAMERRGNWRNKPRGNGGGFAKNIKNIKTSKFSSDSVTYFDEVAGTMKSM